MAQPPPITDSPTSMSDGSSAERPNVDAIELDPSDPAELLPLPPGHPAIPDVSQIILDDGLPVESLYSQIFGRLLCDILYGSWRPGAAFLAVTDVGLFYRTGTPPIVPDMMLKMDCPPRGSLLANNYNNGFFVWDRGVPEIAIEAVSRTNGGETTKKVEIYERAGVPNYVVWDPAGFQSRQPLRYWTQRSGKMVETDLPETMPLIGLGLTPWEGEYEGQHDLYLRWTDAEGTLLRTKAEVVEEQIRQTEQMRNRVEEQQARAEEQQARAEEQQARAEEQQARAEAAEAELERLRRQIDARDKG